MELGFNLIEPCALRQRDGPTDGPLFDVSDRHPVFDVSLHDLDRPPADFQPSGERVVRDVHVFLLDAGYVELGGDPRAIRGILEFDNRSLPPQRRRRWRGHSRVRLG